MLRERPQMLRPHVQTTIAMHPPSPTFWATKQGSRTHARTHAPDGEVVLRLEAHAAGSAPRATTPRAKKALTRVRCAAIVGFTGAAGSARTETGKKLVYHYAMESCIRASQQRKRSRTRCSLQCCRVWAKLSSRE